MVCVIPTVIHMNKCNMYSLFETMRDKSYRTQTFVLSAFVFDSDYLYSNDLYMHCLNLYVFMQITHSQNLSSPFVFFG